jgi:hypothetical protein
MQHADRRSLLMANNRHSVHIITIYDFHKPTSTRTQVWLDELRNDITVYLICTNNRSAFDSRYLARELYAIRRTSVIDCKHYFTRVNRGIFYSLPKRVSTSYDNKKIILRATYKRRWLVAITTVITVVL